jgi:FMN phosphatase YigB (HAD superfamily)
MKYIFDFDRVLFNVGRHWTNHTFIVLEKAGVPKEVVEAYYDKERWNLFSMKKMLEHFAVPQEVYLEVMKEVESFRNHELIEVISKLGRENCFIVTYGDEEFQFDKIRRTGIADLFSAIFTVAGAKNEPIEEICRRFPDEKIIFIDDSKKHIDELDLVKCPNLKAILYDENGLEKLKEEIKK